MSFDSSASASQRSSRRPSWTGDEDQARIRSPRDRPEKREFQIGVTNCHGAQLPHTHTHRPQPWLTDNVEPNICDHPPHVILQYNSVDPRIFLRHVEDLEDPHVILLLGTEAGVGGQDSVVPVPGRYRRSRDGALEPHVVTLVRNFVVGKNKEFGWAVELGGATPTARDRTRVSFTPAWKFSIFF